MTDDNRARLIAARKKLGLSRRQMAAKLLAPHVTYEEWETGARRVPGVAVLAAESVARIRHPKARAVGNSAVAPIRRFADGRRTAAEVAAAAGVSIARVYRATRAAKEDGRPLVFARAAGNQQRIKRNAAIADAIRQGSTLQEQGDKYGISRQAVQQIVLRHGVHASALRKAKSIRRARMAAQERERSRRERERSEQERLRAKHLLEEKLIDMKVSGLTYKEISDRAGVSMKKLSKVVHANNATRPQVKRDLATRTIIATRWSKGEDAELLAAEFHTTVGYVKTMSYGLGFRRRSREKRTNK